MRGMFHALLICTDDGCEALYEAWGSLEEIESLACDCHCTLQVVRWAEERDGDGQGIELVPLAA
jgi:hypothetical protein